MYEIPYNTHNYKAFIFEVHLIIVQDQPEKNRKKVTETSTTRQVDRVMASRQVRRKTEEHVLTY